LAFSNYFFIILFQEWTEKQKCIPLSLDLKKPLSFHPLFYISSVKIEGR